MCDKPVAIVTGASRGMASLGYDLVINRAQNEEPAVLKEAQRLDAACVFAPGNISETEVRKQIVDAARSAFGRCDMLVNNAGAAPSQRLDILEPLPPNGSISSRRPRRALTECSASISRDLTSSRNSSPTG